MSLIARHFEARGLPTLILGSALDIMSAGKPPRISFLNYPLGFESGRFQDKANQLDVVREALSQFDAMKKPDIYKMDYEYPEGWELMNERDRSSPDHRSPRTTEPQYQSEEDRIAATSGN